MIKKCGICGEIVEDSILECPNCGRGVFESEKLHRESKKANNEVTPIRDTDQNKKMHHKPNKLPTGKTSWVDKILGGKRKTPIDDPVYDGKTISKWISDLQGDDYESINAVNSLVKAGSLAVPQLIINLKNSNTDVRKMIPLILGRMETRAIEAVQALTNSCNDSYPMVAIGARYALIMITGDVDKHLPALCKYLESRDPVSRGAAAHAIGMIGNKALRAARKLFEMRQKETDPAAYQQASNALQRIGWNPAIGAIPDVDFY